MTHETEPLITVGDLVRSLDRRFPFAWADPWDRVGLVTGERSLPVTGVLVTLDATGAAVREAVSRGANVLVTHHPPYLDPPARAVASTGPLGTLQAALELDVAVISLHTCLDRSPAGAEALARALGLIPLEPLERGVEEIAVVTVFAPVDALEPIANAMSAAGAGRIGAYEGCGFTAEGTGRFTPMEGATPAVPARAEGVSEGRLEMICPRAVMPEVVEAARRTHPYEEPLVFAVDAVRARGGARYGRICEWERRGTVRELAVEVERILGTTVRIWGEAERTVRRVGTANGSGSSLLPSAVGMCEVLVTGEVRYHDALGAVADGLCIIEAGHDATEWPLVEVLASAITDIVGSDVPVYQVPPYLAWRTTEDVDDGG